MANGQDWGQPGQYPQDGQPWGPQQYNPGAHQQRIGGGGQNAPQGQPHPWGPGLPFQGQQAPPVPQGWQPGYGQQPYPGQQPLYPPQPQYGQGAPAAQQPRKRRHVFMWVFLAIQVVFLRLGRARRAAAVLGMLAVPLAAAGITAVPASAATDYAVTATIPVGSYPVGVGVDPSTQTAYVANSNSGTVSVIDELTNTVTATIPVGGEPDAVGVDPSTNTIYVANFEGSVAVIDGASNTVTATIPVSGVSVAVDPSTNTIYVANPYGSVSVIDGATNTVTAAITLGGGDTGGIAVNSSTNTIYVVQSSYDNVVAVIDGATNTVTATIPVGDDWGIAVNPSTNTVYVSGGATAAVIDGATNTVTGTINADGEWVAVDPSTNTVYVAGGTVSVIDGASNTVTATIPVGSYSEGVGVDPSTHAAYVAISSSNTVSVITPTRTLGIGQTITQNGNSTVTTPAFSTTGPRLLVAFTSSDGPSTKQTTTVTGAGLTWTLIQRANTKGGTAEIWDAQATGQLTGVTVTSKPKIAGYDQSLTVVAFTGASGIGASALAGKSGGVPSVSLNTTQAGSWVFGVGEDYSNAIARTLGANESLVSQWVDPGPGETFWVQDESAPTPAAGTAVTINDTAPKGDIWELAAVEILPAGS